MVAANGGSAACNPRTAPPHTQDDERCLADLDEGRWYLVLQANHIFLCVHGGETTHTNTQNMAGFQD